MLSNMKKMKVVSKLSLKNFEDLKDYRLTLLDKLELNHHDKNVIDIDDLGISKSN